MNENELDLKRAELAIRGHKTRVSDAKRNMEEGYRRLMSELEEKYGKLKSDYERELIELEEYEAKLQYAKEKVSKNFD